MLITTPLVATNERWPLVTSLWPLMYILNLALFISHHETGSGAGLRAGRHSAKQRTKAFSHGGVRKHSIAQRGIRQLPHHRGLDHRQDLGRVWRYCREADDFIAVVADER